MYFRITKGENTMDNEKIISALITNPTVESAAKACGISPRTIQNRMRNKEFRSLYFEARNEVLRSAVYTCNNMISDAFQTMRDIMNDNEVKPEIRLKTAETVIATAFDLSGRLKTAEYEARTENKTLSESLDDFTF